MDGLHTTNEENPKAGIKKGSKKNPQPRTEVNRISTQWRKSSHHEKTALRENKAGKALFGIFSRKSKR